MWRFRFQRRVESLAMGLMRGEEVVGGKKDWPRRYAERLIWMARSAEKAG